MISNEENSYEEEEITICAEKLDNRLPKTNNVIRGQKDSYAVGHKISSGKYGGVYELLRRRDGKRFAAKLEICDVNSNALNMDYAVLKAASTAKFDDHFASLIDRGKIEGHFKFLVMKLVGENLQNLRHQFEGYRFSAPTALRLAGEMLTAIEQLHLLRFVHRDIKPSNFAILEEDHNTKLYLIDFGLSKQFCSHRTGELKSPREHTEFRGTPRYASIAAHKSHELSRRDDLESWLYVITEFMAGDLPWSIYQPTDKDLIYELKMNVRKLPNTAQLFVHCPIAEFVQILRYLDELTYYSQPDYNHIRQLLHTATTANDINIEQPYDWQLS